VSRQTAVAQSPLAQAVSAIVFAPGYRKATVREVKAPLEIRK
jgi:hypothetical protein